MTYVGETKLHMLIRAQLNTARLQATLIKTWEGCLADAGLIVSGCGRKTLPLQLKTSHRHCGQHGHLQFKFSRTNRYPGCLVVCCAFLRDQSRIWLIPGNDLTDVKSLTITEGGKWDRFAVHEDQLGHRLLLAHRALTDAPSCHDPAYFQPQTKKQRLEVDGYRQLMAFRNLRLSFPETEHGAVDCIVSLGSCHMRCQCKTAFQIQGRSGFRAALTRDRSGAQPVPYQAGDFDMLIVHVPKDPSRKFFIPAHELKNRGFLTDDFCKGKKSITVYMNDTHWTAAFLRHESCTGNPLSIGAHDKFVEIKSSQVDSIDNKLLSSDSVKDTRLHKAPQIGRNPEEAQLPNCQVDCSRERVHVRCPSIATESHHRCKKECCTARKCPGGDQTNQITHCCRLEAMQWQSENAFTQSIHTVPCACSIIPISRNPNDTSLPSQCMQPASILRRQMEQSCKLPPACSKQRDACTNIEKAESQPIDPIVTLDCCFLTGILHSTPHSLRCAASAGHGRVRNQTHQIPRYHKLLHIQKKNADAISMHDIQRQRCIKTGLHRAQEVPLCRQRTHPSISRLKPNMLFQIQTDRIHTNTTRQRSTAKACTFFAPEPLGVLSVKALHRPHCGASIVWHLAGKIASHPNTKRPQHECEAGCMHYLKMKTLTAHIHSRNTHTITASAGTGLVQPHSFSEDSCFGF